jgi:hypothetical protein
LIAFLGTFWDYAFRLAQVSLPEQLAMVAPNDFWLNLHRLSNSLEAGGENSSERIENIVAEFREMPLVAQCEVISDLTRLITYLPGVFPRVMVAASQLAVTHSDATRKTA